MAGLEQGSSEGKRGAVEEVPKHPSDLDEGEGLSGGSDRHDRVATLLADLTKTARSFLLYDARNAAIHRFLSDLLDSFTEVLKENGDIDLTVQSLEIFYEGACVYLNRDRERSLAFRLYRDGVRGLTIRQGFTAEEMAKLLEVLSIRYTGVQQSEEDMVTLLWKAEFKHIDIGAVEGIVQDDSDYSVPTLPQNLSSQNMGGAPELSNEPTRELGMLGQIDLPGPHLPERGRVRWIEIEEGELLKLRQEVSEGAIAAECMQLLYHIEACLNDPRERMKLDEMSHVFTEILDFLLTEEHLPYFRNYLDILRQMYEGPAPSWDLGRQSVVQGLFERGGSVEAVRRLLRSMEESRAEVPPDLLHVLDELSRDPLAVVAEVVLSERRDLPMAVTRGLFERYGEGNVPQLIHYFDVSEMPLSLQLFQVIAKLGGDSAAEFIVRQLAHSEEIIQREALSLLSGFDYSTNTGKAMVEAFRKGSFEIKVLLVTLMLDFSDPRFVSLIVNFIDRDGADLSSPQAHKIGSRLGIVGGEKYQRIWLDWLRPIGLIAKQLPGHRSRQLTAAAALAEFPGDTPLKTLRAARMVADVELQPWFSRCISRQRGVQVGSQR